jgi:periodic tryptophan protein 1
LEFEDNADDPHIDPDYHSDSNEDVEIQEGDQLILAAHTEDEQASLSVYLYNDELEQLYVHHDVMLPDMPLCVEWIGAAPMTREAGNWAAVGTLSPEIELWNLDILNATNPHAVLAAGAKSEGGKKSKKKNKKKDKARGELGGHSEAVLGLAWNKAQANVLASCSADATVRLWDLNETRCSAVFDRLHTSKIQSVLWSPSTASVLATGGFDRRARVADVRDVSSALTIALDADVECLRWVPGQPSQLLVATEAGEVLLFDVAQLAKVRFLVFFLAWLISLSSGTGVAHAGARQGVHGSGNDGAAAGAAGDSVAGQESQDLVDCLWASRAAGGAAEPVWLWRAVRRGDFRGDAVRVRGGVRGREPASV